jgi:hypothetical protein
MVPSGSGAGFMTPEMLMEAKKHQGMTKKLEVKEEKSLSPIVPLTIDYPNEWLNDIARKINELVERVNHA